jgi:hypothetical protein
MSEVESEIRDESKKVSESMLQKLLSWLSNSGVLNLGVITAVVTISGAFVIHSYIHTFTNMLTFKISVAQYIAAGLNLIIGTLIIIILGLLPSIAYGVAMVLALIIIWSSMLVGIYYLIGRKPLKVQVVSDFQVRIGNAARLSRTLFILLLLIAAVVYSGIYGTNFYGVSPHEIGGGQPADVILIFDDPELLAALPIPSSPISPYRTETVQLLMELDNGYIIRHVSSRATLFIASNSVQAIIDVYPPSHDTSAPTSNTNP